MGRIIASFSCGAASAVATKIALNTMDNVEIINITIKEEHPDNRRFLADCERWFGRKITVLMSEEYGGSIYEVFAKERMITSPKFTPCSKFLKKVPARDYYRHDDELVMGFTIEEESRADRFIDANNERHCHFPLIDAGLTKPDCLAMVERAGIELPAMYRMGYANANCIGCVRGGLGYWNKIRRDFPDVFEKMAQVEDSLGASILRYRSGEMKGKRMKLRDLPPGAGIHPVEIMPECSIFCEATDL